MNLPASPNSNSPRATISGQSRIALLLAVAVSAALAAGAAVYLIKDRSQPVKAEAPVFSSLTEGTRGVLQNLDSPVEIRFYSLLDPKSTSESLETFSTRVEQLLASYEREGAGQIRVVRHTSITEAAPAKAAATDGLRPFNIHLGDACFLGIAVVQEDRRESLPQLSPEWENALEADLSRAIARVSTGKRATAPVVSSFDAKTEAAALVQIRQALPNLETLTLEEGRRILRQSMFEEFKSAAQKMQAEMRQAEERLNRTQSGASEAEQQAALKELQQLQQVQADKLKEIAARSQAQVEALERLKSPTAGGQRP